MILSKSGINLYLKLLQIKLKIGKIWKRFTGTEKTIYVWDRISQYKKIWQNASTEISAKFFELADGVWEIQYGNQITRINNYMVQLDDPVILNLAVNKVFCYSEFKKNNLPVPNHLCFAAGNMNQAKKFMEQETGYFVVKPASSTSAGMGVTTHIKTFNECRKAIALASLYCDEIIIEKLIPGECFRLLILHGKMIHASRRRGLRIIGDGKSNIGQLIDNENRHRHSMENDNDKQPFKIDRDIQATLEAQGFSKESILKNNQEILVKSYDNIFNNNIEIRTIYNENVTNLICQDIKLMAIKSTEILNSKFAGIDIITLDPTVPLIDNNGVISEINTTPGLHHHYDLLNNEEMNPAVDVLKYLLKA